ncbi:hypothetical protein Ah1_00298 [Aeromonas phage Ah1]|uniref:Uncharacterized protein n=1 Tax=Aeromonas phage Ah1 TaxID=2053701 RepID=A0A2H4YFU9_9CAUD|nr:hypothetical protein KNT77_gp220 [Aeromonas phage Ah1]AUE22816.1 hypothetical protein Ah1_00298 [Aeromonas phage Ah1]
MIDRVYDGQQIRFISDEHKKQYFENLGLASGTSAYHKIHNVMNQPVIVVDSVIEGCVDKLNGVTMTYNPILQSDYVYFEEAEQSTMNKLIEKIKAAFKAGRESEIMEISLIEILKD